MTIYPVDADGKPDLSKSIVVKGDALAAVRAQPVGDYIVAIAGGFRRAVCEDQTITKRVARFLDDQPVKTRKPRKPLETATS